MAAPSTAWREQIAADEDTRFAGYADQFAAMQRAKSARFGTGRALHRKQQLGLKATPLDVIDNPKKLKFVELEAAQLPRSLDDLDAAAVHRRGFPLR